MTNGHHATSAFEAEDLPVDAARKALERLISLADAIEQGNLGTEDHAAAQAALAALQGEIQQAPPSFRQQLASASAHLDRSVWDALQKAVDGAKPIRVASWGLMRPPARQWLVEDWLPAGRVAMLTGEGGAGKSRLALQLAAGVASGGSDSGAWLRTTDGVLRLGDAIPREGAPVVFASWEDEPDEFFRRLFQISGGAAEWVTPERLRNLRIANMMGEGPVWAPSQGSHISSMAELTDTGQRLRRLCERTGARLLIMDPLAAAYASQENTRGLVRAFVSHWDDWAQANDCTILLLAHPPKSSMYNYAGSTDWLGAVRALWSLQREDQSGQDDRSGPTTWKLDSVKGNYRGPTESVRLEWDVSNDHLRWQVAGAPNRRPAEGAYDYDS